MADPKLKSRSRKSSSGLWGDTRITPPKPAGPPPHGDESGSGLTTPLGGMKTNRGENDGMDTAFRRDRSSLSFRAKIPRTQPSETTPRIQIRMREFLVSATRGRASEQSTRWNAFPSSFTRSKTQRREWPRSLNRPSRIGAQGAKSQEALSHSTPIPAGLHLGRAQPFDRLRDHPLMAVWIAEQATPVAMKMGF